MPQCAQYEIKNEFVAECGNSGLGKTRTAMKANNVQDYIAQTKEKIQKANGIEPCSGIQPCSDRVHIDNVAFEQYRERTAYDCILMIHVFEHLSDPVEVLQIGNRIGKRLGRPLL